MKIKGLNETWIATAGLADSRGILLHIKEDFNNIA